MSWLYRCKHWWALSDNNRFFTLEILRPLPKYGFHSFSSYSHEQSKWKSQVLSLHPYKYSCFSPPHCLYTITSVHFLYTNAMKIHWKNISKSIKILLILSNNTIQSPANLIYVLLCCPLVLFVHHFDQQKSSQSCQVNWSNRGYSYVNFEGGHICNVSSISKCSCTFKCFKKSGVFQLQSNIWPPAISLDWSTSKSPAWSLDRGLLQREDPVRRMHWPADPLPPVTRGREWSGLSVWLCSPASPKG